MDWMLARDVREAEASNKRWVAKLNLEQSAASSQSAETRAKAMLIRSKAVAAKRAELVADLMLVVRALEEQDTVRLLHPSRHTAALTTAHCRTAHCSTHHSPLQHSSQHTAAQSTAAQFTAAQSTAALITPHCSTAHCSIRHITPQMA